MSCFIISDGWELLNYIDSMDLHGLTSDFQVVVVTFPYMEILAVPSVHRADRQLT